MPIRGSIRTKLVIGSACLVLAMCFVVYAYMTRTSELQLRTSFDSETVSLGRAAAALIGNMVSTGDIDAIVRVAPQILRLPDTERMAIFGPEGQILVSFPDSTMIFESESVSSGIVRLRSSVVASAEIPGGGRLLIERSVRRLHAQMTQSHAKALELCIVLAVMGTLVTWIFTAHVTTPLRKIADAAARVGGGDYQKVNIPRRNDEFTTLAEHFNLMVDEIARKTRSLEETNQQLRHEVLDRRMIACALEESQQRLKHIIANAPIVLFAYDRNGVITFCEGRPTGNLPSRPEHIVGRPVRDVYPFHERIKQNAERALAGETFSDEVALDSRTFEIHYSACRDDEGMPNGVIGVAVDITARKHLEHERNELQDMLAEAQKMEAVGNLAGGFAHGFNNLLVGIMGHADLLRDRDTTPRDGHKSADAIYRAAERASMLTQQLLGFAGRGKFQSTKVDVHHMIENCLQLLTPALSTGVRVQLELGASNRLLIGDPGQMEQMLMNLIKNACEAMPDGGTLTLRTSNVEYELKMSEGDIDVPAREHVMISICDTGVGIPGHLRERIFEPFFSSKPSGSGAGMGLAMAHGIIESHGGSIRFTSRVAIGTEFDVILPCAVVGAEAILGVTATDNLNKTPQRILVVDDDDIVREMLEELLVTLGHEAICAKSGFAAVELFAADHAKFDLIILDMLMPGMDGPECFRRLQTTDSSVPVLISSGYASNNSVQALIDSGAVGFLKKPYTVRELSRAIAGGMRPRQKKSYGSVPVTITARPSATSQSASVAAPALETILE
jgi:PAS domain S-box-containing protein